MSHIVTDFSNWAQGQISSELKDLLGIVAGAIDDMAKEKGDINVSGAIRGLHNKQPEDKGLRDMSRKGLPNEAVRWLAEHPLASQRDRIVTSGGACAKYSDVYVHGENSANYLPGNDEQMCWSVTRTNYDAKLTHLPKISVNFGFESDPEYRSSDALQTVFGKSDGTIQFWPCIMHPDRASDHDSKNHINYFEDYQYSVASAQRYTNIDNPLSIGGLHVKEKTDSEINSDKKIWQIKTILLTADGIDEDIEGVEYIPYQSLLPAFPMCKINNKKEMEEANKTAAGSGGILLKEEPNKKPYAIGDMAPDVLGFYIQWAKCSTIVMQMLCDENESPFILKGDYHMKDAVAGCLEKFDEWLEESGRYEAFDHDLYPKAAPEKPGKGQILKAEITDLAKAARNMEGNAIIAPLEVLHVLQHVLPGACDTYLFPQCKASVPYDPKHPLALCNLNCHYQHWIMKSLDIMNGEQYPTMGMVRAYAIADDAFKKNARSMKGGGLFFQWPAGPLLRAHAREKGVEFVSDRESIDEAMGKFTIAEQLMFLSRFLFDVVMDIKLKLRSAAQKSSKDMGNGNLSVYNKAVADLIHEHQPFLFLFMDYATRMAGLQQEAEMKGFGIESDADGVQKLPAHLKGYSVFRDPVMGQTLSVAIASGTWATYTLYRAPLKVKNSSRGVTDADIQLMLSSADKNGLDKDFAIKLQKEIASQHDQVFASASVMDSMCKHVKGHTIEFYDVETNQPVSSSAWKWGATESDGSRKPELTAEGKKKYQRKWDAGLLVPDCKHLLMLYSDDALSPQVLPHPPMDANGVYKFLERARKHDRGDESLFMKIQKRYHQIKPEEVMRAVKRKGYGPNNSALPKINKSLPAASRK